MVFPIRSRLDKSIEVQIPPALWVQVETLADTLPAPIKRERPMVIAADVAPTLAAGREAEVVDWLIQPPTDVLLELARPETWRQKGYQKKLDVLRRFESTRGRKIPAQTPTCLVESIPSALRHLQQSFFLRFQAPNRESCCRFWSADERYRNYRDRRQSVKEALQLDPKGRVYRPIHPEIVYDLGRAWYRMFRLFLVYVEATERYECVGGVAVDERRVRDPEPRLSFATIA